MFVFVFVDVRSARPHELWASALSADFEQPQIFYFDFECLNAPQTRDLRPADGKGIKE